MGIGRSRAPFIREMFHLTKHKDMRILELENRRELSELTLYLTSQEAEELQQSLVDMIRSPKGNHCHINDENFERELTVCVYQEEDLSDFDEVSKQIIIGDKTSGQPLP